MTAMAVCAGQWCCGCPLHPIGKPWGWNHRAWEAHYTAAHPHPPESGEPGTQEDRA